MANIGTLTANITANTSMLQADLNRARKSMTRFVGQSNTGLGAMTSGVKKLTGVIGGLAAAMLALRAFKDVTEIGESFEQTMVTVGGVTRATAEQLVALSKSAREMGEVTEFTARQAGESLLFLGRAGFQVDKAISALPGTLDLATAGSIDLGRAADIASNALTAMTLPVEQLGRVNDVFIGTINRTNTNMEQMAEAFKYSAPVANAFGYSIEELAALIGTLGNAGVQGSMAGTQLAMAMQRANDVAVQFGYDSADLLDVLESMSKEGRTNADIMQLFGIRAGRAALILKDAVDPAKELQETLGGVGGEAAELADKMRSSFGGVKKELMSVIESIKIDVFDLYSDSLKETMQDTTKWLRENKTEILAWVDTIIKGFKEVWAVVTTVLEIAAKFVSGISDVYEELEKQSKETTDAMVKDSERLQEAFSPASIEPWQEILNALENAGMALVDILLFVAKATGIVVGGIAKTIVNDLILNVLDALWEFAGVIERLVALDFSGAGDRAAGVFTNLADIVNDTDKTASAVFTSLVASFHDMVNEFDFRSVRDKIVDFEFSGMIDKVAAQNNAAADNLAESRHRMLAGLGTGIHRAKGVSLTTTGDDDDAEKRRKQMELLLDQRVSMNAALLESEGKTRDEMLVIWARYESLRIEQIIAEHEAMLQAGIEAELVQEHYNMIVADLMEQRKAMFTDEGSWLTEWAGEIATDMNSAFSDFFFDVMKGEFTSFTDYLTNVWNNMLRKMADRAADELSGVFSEGGFLGELFGGGGSGSGGGVIPMQTGGIVTHPTLAMVGEVPEAVVPLSKLRDDAFMRSLGSASGERPNISMVVNTPDVQSFKASQSQLLSQAAVALGLAQRRNT